MTETKFNTATSQKPGPLFIILSGPSGAGKDTVIAQLKNAVPNADFVITLTTRSKRTREKSDISYHFVPVETFQRLQKDKQLLESANVYGNWYGVPKEPVQKALAQGKDVVVKVDVQGAATLKKLAPGAISIFLMPPTQDELSSRLKLRHTESVFDMNLRLKTADDEIKELDSFDYVVVNRQGEVDLAVSAIVSIMVAEKHRINRPAVSLG